MKTLAVKLASALALISTPVVAFAATCCVAGAACCIGMPCCP